MNGKQNTRRANKTKSCNRNQNLIDQDSTHGNSAAGVAEAMSQIDQTIGMVAHKHPLPTPSPATIRGWLSQISDKPDRCEYCGGHFSPLPTAKPQVYSGGLDGLAYAAAFDECFDYDAYSGDYLNTSLAHRNQKSSTSAGEEALNYPCLADNESADSPASHEQAIEIVQAQNQLISSLPTIRDHEDQASFALEQETFLSYSNFEQDEISPSIAEQKDSSSSTSPVSADEICKSMLIEHPVSNNIVSSDTKRKKNQLSFKENHQAQTNSSAIDLLLQQQMINSAQVAARHVIAEEYLEGDFDEQFPVLNSAIVTDYLSETKPLPTAIAEYGESSYVTPIGRKPSAQPQNSARYAQAFAPYQAISNSGYEEIHEYASPGQQNRGPAQDKTTVCSKSTVSTTREKRPRSETPELSAKCEKHDPSGPFKENGEPNMRAQVKYLKEFFGDRFEQEMKTLTIVPAKNTVHRRKAARINMFSATERAAFLLFVKRKLAEEVMEDEDDENDSFNPTEENMPHADMYGTAPSRTGSFHNMAPTPFDERQKRNNKKSRIKLLQMGNKSNGTQRSKRTIDVEKNFDDGSSLGINPPFVYTPGHHGKWPNDRLQDHVSSITGGYGYSPYAPTSNPVPSLFPQLQDLPASHYHTRTGLTAHQSRHSALPEQGIKPPYFCPSNNSHFFHPDHHVPNLGPIPQRDEHQPQLHENKSYQSGGSALSIDRGTFVPSVAHQTLSPANHILRGGLNQDPSGRASNQIDKNKEINSMVKNDSNVQYPGFVQSRFSESWARKESLNAEKEMKPDFSRPTSTKRPMMRKR